MIKKVKVTTSDGVIIYDNLSTVVLKKIMNCVAFPNNAKILDFCVEKFGYYPAMLQQEQAATDQLRESFSFQILLWMREYGDIERLEFSISNPDEVRGIENANDLLQKYTPKPISAQWRTTVVNGKVFNSIIEEKLLPINSREVMQDYVNRVSESLKFTMENYLPKLKYCVECGIPNGLKIKNAEDQTCNQCNVLKKYGLLEQAKQRNVAERKRRLAANAQIV